MRRGLFAVTEDCDTFMGDHNMDSSLYVMYVKWGWIHTGSSDIVFAHRLETKLKKKKELFLYNV